MKQAQTSQKQQKKLSPYRRFGSPHTTKAQHLKYRRIILKISGEMLGSHNDIYNLRMIDYITEQIVRAHDVGTKVGIVVGGGNLIRGREAQWLNKVDADLCGMMATIINGIVLYTELHKKHVAARLSSSIEVSGIVKRANIFEDRQFYESGDILICIGGTGNPLFTTDTAAALRAVEFGADIVIKATKVEGVYSVDPNKSRTAQLYKRLTYDEAIIRNLAVMDMAAFTICRDAHIPMCVYNCMKYDLIGVLQGKTIGTLVASGG